MKLITKEHEKVIEHLKNIKNTIDEMGNEGLCGNDFAILYLTQKLFPTIESIFAPDLDRLGYEAAAEILIKEKAS